jgi:hypothetical protein
LVGTASLSKADGIAARASSMIVAFMLNAGAKFDGACSPLLSDQVIQPGQVTGGFEIELLKITGSVQCRDGKLSRRRHGTDL